jgi:hypothetical protein
LWLQSKTTFLSKGLESSISNFKADLILVLRVIFFFGLGLYIYNSTVYHIYYFYSSLFTSINVTYPKYYPANVGKILKWYVF